MATPKNMLSPEQTKSLNDARARIPELKAAIARAKLAKIDTTGMEQTLKDLETRINALHSVYVLGKTTLGD